MTLGPVESGDPLPSYSRRREMLHDQALPELDMLHSMGHLTNNFTSMQYVGEKCADLVHVPLSRGTLIYRCQKSAYFHGINAFRCAHAANSFDQRALAG